MRVNRLNSIFRIKFSLYSIIYDAGRTKTTFIHQFSNRCSSLSIFIQKLFRKYKHPQSISWLVEWILVRFNAFFFFLCIISIWWLILIVSVINVFFLCVKWFYSLARITFLYLVCITKTASLFSVNSEMYAIWKVLFMLASVMPPNLKVN